MSPRRVPIPPDRLREIEVLAAKVRAEAEEGARALGAVAPTAFELVQARACPVRAIRNLTHEGHRQAGLLDCTGLVPRIYYEEYDPLPRQRFSVAHEVGHFILHEPRRRARAGCPRENVDPPISGEEGAVEPDAGARSSEDASQPADEAEADAFAAAFLLPRALVDAAIAEYGVSTDFLAERFGVSVSAMQRRLLTLQDLAE